MSGRGVRWAAAGARAAAGTAVAAGFALAVATLASVPLPRHTGTPVTVVAVPTPSDAVAVCAGPLLAAGREASDAGALGAAASQRLVAATAAGEAPPATILAGPAAGDGAAAYTVAPDGRAAGVFAAAGSAAAEAADLRGYSAAACRPPRFESWLVAGSATTGAADLVTLANPGAVAATVTLTVYGAGGATTAPGGVDVVVAPGAQLAIPLAGLRLGEATPVVRVTATGAPVAAGLQSSVTRTLVPGGAEQTAAVDPPSSGVVIPGVVVPDGIAPGPEPATVLRVLAPAGDGVATVTLARTDGGAAPAPQQVPLLGAQPVEVDLGVLAAGIWLVRVDADVAVTAAVRQATGFAEGADFAWFEAAPALTGVALAAVADGPAPVLALANTSAAPASVTVAAAGAATEVLVPASGTAAVPVSAGSMITLDAGDALVHAAVAYSAPGALSGYPLWPGDAAASAITVHP